MKANQDRNGECHLKNTKQKRFNLPFFASIDELDTKCIFSIAVSSLDTTDLQLFQSIIKLYSVIMFELEETKTQSFS